MNYAEISIKEIKEEFPLRSKTFSTGSVGFNASGKMQIGDKKYQITVNVVEIGSKGKRGS